MAFDEVNPEMRVERLGKWLPWLLLVGVLFSSPLLYQALKFNMAAVGYFKQVSALPGDQAARLRVPAGHPRSALWIAVADLRAGDYQAAIQAAQPYALAGDRLALEIVAQANESLGNFTAAAHTWEQSYDVAVLLRLAEAAAQAEKLDQALEVYRAAWQIDPVAVASPMADFLERKMGDPYGAEVILRQSLERKSVYLYRPYWLLRLAELLTKQSRWAEAAEAYKQAIEVSDLMYPDEKHLARSYADLAHAYLMSDQIPAAVEAVEAGLAHLADDPAAAASVWLQAGQVYEAAGMTAKALAAYRQVLALQPEDKTAQDALQRLSGAP
jgi:tetratricopeptide (TPR) repeat protein